MAPAATEIIVDGADLTALPRRQDQRLTGEGTIGNAQEFLDKGDHLAATHYGKEALGNFFRQAIETAGIPVTKKESKQ